MMEDAKELSGMMRYFGAVNKETWLTSAELF